MLLGEKLRAGLYGFGRFAKRAASKSGTKVLAIFCALVLSCSFFTMTVPAETPQEKYKRLKEELESTRGQINSLKGQKDAAAKQKAALEAEKLIIDELVEINRQEVARTELELAAKEDQVAMKRQVIYENDQLLQKRLVALYQMNTGSTLGRLLQVESISEFFMVTDAMRAISRHDTDLLDMLTQQRVELEAQQAEIDTMLQDLWAYYEDLENTQIILAQNIADQDSRISQAEANLKAQEELKVDQEAQLAQAQKEMAAIAGSIGGSRPGDGSKYVGGVFTWPVPGYYTISCHYGSPDPNGRGHRGMDISTNRQVGPDIVACGDGTVITASYAHSSYGNYIVVDHGDGVKTLYAHCNALYASVGTEVKKGDPIAAVGSTGFSTGPHLHLEVLVGNSLQDPAGWLRG